MGKPILLLASGSNARGQLANGTADDSHIFAPCNFLGCLSGSLPPNTCRIVDIASGSNHALALLERQGETGEVRKELWGCGNGGKGQLGPMYVTHGEQTPGASGSVFRPLDLPWEDYGLDGYECRLVASAWETSYIVLSSHGKSDVMISMGVDDFGDLGIGESNTRKNAVRPLNIVKFDNIVSRGRHLDYDSLSVESVSAGPHHIIIQVVISSDTSEESLTIGWGASRHGQLGLSSQTRAAFSSAPQLISRVPISDLDRVVSSSLGAQHSVFLHASGRISCLGSNKKGQLQDLTTLRNVRSVGCTWHGTYVDARSSDNPETQVFATGSHVKGQLGRILPSSTELELTIPPLAPVNFPFTSASRNLESMASGSEHILSLFRVIRNDSATTTEVETEVWGWGWNEHGNLGVGSTEDISLPTRIWPGRSCSNNDVGRAVGIWAGCGTSWIALEL